MVRVSLIVKQNLTVRYLTSTALFVTGGYIRTAALRSSETHGGLGDTNLPSSGARQIQSR